MTNVRIHIEPMSVWKHFSRITEIPHCSGNEEALRAYILECARLAACVGRVDKAGNVIVKKPAHPLRKGSPGVILQSHMDMVCEKDAHSLHDFSKDPLPVIVEGDWIMAQGTTLGADNGIGIAVTLAVLEDSSIVHGPLEALFTVDEERGLVGASALEPGSLSGRYLFNLDSEEEGVLCVGCAGGADSVLTIPVQRKPVLEHNGFELRVIGLTGGHSGIDIHLGRANAIKVLGRVLFSLDEQVGIELAAIEGGSARNAIPREARAHLVLKQEEVPQVHALVERLAREIAYEFRHADPGMRIELSPSQDPFTPLTEVSTQLLLRALMVLPHGVLAMSQDITGLVETSTNLASVRTSPTQVEVAIMSRSAAQSALDHLQASFRAFAHLLNARIEQPEGYPGS